METFCNKCQAMANHNGCPLQDCPLRLVISQNDAKKNGKATKKSSSK